MKRGRPLRANPAKQRDWQDRSRQAQVLDADERAVREAVFKRDGYRCALRDHVGALVSAAPLAIYRPGDECGPADRVVEVPRCLGGLSYQHRRKASAQGAYTEANGATLCWGHNGWVEDEPDAAVAVCPFLVVREGDPEWDQLGRRAARHR